MFCTKNIFSQKMTLIKINYWSNSDNISLLWLGFFSDKSERELPVFKVKDVAVRDQKEVELALSSLRI
jgi:hypothetical protein